MSSRGVLVLAAGLLGTALMLAPGEATSHARSGAPGPDALPSAPPATPVKLVFIHHSTGEQWLSDDGGRLGLTLAANRYYVSDTNYGWGPGSIGDTTDTGHWWTWFRGSSSATALRALYTEYRQHSGYTRLSRDPGGENRIVLFKSCFPNSHIGGRPGDPPRTGNNPLRGQDAGSPYLTVANVKGLYRDLLSYFATRPDKLFVLVASPPLVSDATDAAHAANARAVHDWLVDDWLDAYPLPNVAAFDFYTVLTSNGGSPNTHDLGRVAGNHHRLRNDVVEHTRTVARNVSAYGSSPGDSHPTAAGGIKASGEFVSLLNLYYARWKAGPRPPTATSVSPASGSLRAGVRVTVAATWSDVNGSTDLDDAQVLVGATTSQARSALLSYDQPSNRLSLRTDAGTAWTTACTPGSARTLRNSQVSVNCATTTVTLKSASATVRWSLTFSGAYAGARNIYLKATDKKGLTSGWIRKGGVTIT